MKLDYQLMNCRWVECGSRDEEFFSRCVTFQKKLSKDQIIENLNKGLEMAFDFDWNAKIRSHNFAKKREIEINKKMNDYKPKYETVEEFDSRIDET
jgi:hypothetical protein